MYLLGKITVTSIIPERLKHLEDIAQNLWWSWNPDALALYREIDPWLWAKVGKNPVRFIREVKRRELEDAMQNESYMNKYHDVVNKFTDYMQSADTWFSRNFPDKTNRLIAYFSAEYGLSEVIPMYSGGLGVLSGDHCKTASDLGLPFVGIGLLYKQGYFSQHINSEGWQETKFTDLNISDFPINPAIGPDGNEIIVSVDFPERTVFAKVWEIKVGRVHLYLLDTNIDKNNPSDRMITARLYGGDQETRICQEILLGIGGVRVLNALNLNPTVYHMNEGHSAFMGLELIRQLINEKGLTFAQAKEVVAAASVFTTHTPVPAGNDIFSYYLIDKYFSNYWPTLNINRHEFMNMGTKLGDDNQNFNMTVLALNISGRRNGVSRLHGAVSRNLFKSVWKDLTEHEVPIGHITNGIHTLTWISPELRDILNRYLADDWQERISEEQTWDAVEQIKDSELWETHIKLKAEMIEFLNEKLREQRLANGESLANINRDGNILDPNVLTIGFARRFATYKRANLIFRDIERIKEILNNKDMPVQIIFAGKAHPADKPAHDVIKSIYDISKQQGFAGKVVIIENYNMEVARHMVHGVDVWLNNPRRPLEASGTSGQKAGANGVINFSVQDGWWVEGYNGKNGWAIGDQIFYESEFAQDEADSESLYSTMENEIIPLYYTRNELGIPEGWVAKMKESIKSIGPMYSTSRMLIDYITKMYVPSSDRMVRISENDFALAKEISAWKETIIRDWSKIQISADQSLSYNGRSKMAAGEYMPLSAIVNLGNIAPSNIKAEVYFGKIEDENNLQDVQVVEMKPEAQLENNTYRYTTDLQILDGGEYGYTFRIYPYHHELINEFELNLVKWVMQ